jgi:hypothetical protein
LWQQHEADGLVILGAMQEDAQYAAPDVADLNQWNNQFNITHPMLADPQKTQNFYAVLGYPTYVVIDRDMRIANADLWPWDANFITSLL